MDGMCTELCVARRVSTLRDSVSGESRQVRVRRVKQASEQAGGGQAKERASEARSKKAECSWAAKSGNRLLLAKKCKRAKTAMRRL
jgi:hypothetical protein